ncbi:Chromatin assembly factor 1 subunit A [Mizuhopecten yessoensis]|uniref:Chromatin assembly factor 1 subunit A n=1 Tax=Mizuhopecten yessoensis TaxID=6573 RepID=A0A210Q6W4_MIZYE|nr:Chromatin assembly factor 1 subunit A [Mizuhopecten yessoensis]
MQESNLNPKAILGCKDESDGPPSKKLRQARLPFKPLEQKPQIVSPQGPKKRKLSDGESPSAKLHKNHKQERQPSGENKPLTQCMVDHDPEVSSSSEAENIPIGFSNRIRNTLERFVRKGPQEEISSTNECIICIDPEEKNISSDDVAEKQEKINDVQKELSKESPVLDTPKVEETSASPEKPRGSDKTSLNTVQVTSIEDSDNDAVSCSPEKEIIKEDEKDIEPKEDTSKIQPKNEQIVSVEVAEDVSTNDEKDVSMEDSAKETEIEDASMNEESVSSSQEENFNTPAKTKQQASAAPEAGVNQTTSSSPTSTVKPPCPRTPVSQSPESCSDGCDGTPKSGKKAVRTKVSAAKLKEKDLRQKIKEEKEKKLEEKRLKKEEERLEKEEKRKEREEAKALKDKQKEEEKEKKEKERLEKLQLKEEEKKKKQEQHEAKLEEKKKKDEELKLKKEEKMKEEEEKVIVNETKSLFMPFEVKKDMKLATYCPRKQLDDEAAATLDQLSYEQSHDSPLYVEELRTGKIRPKKYKAVDRKLNMDDDVVLVHDSESVNKVTYHCKLLQFHTNYRPPYFGTWRKKSGTVSPRNPWKQDKDLFDYEVESDDEWEEEEPGESLSGSEGEEEEDGGGDGEDEDDWMVPHGYLSDDEGCQADEDVCSMMKAARQAKLDSWESELKRQTKAALPIIIGCVWEQAVHSLQKQVQETINSYKAVCLSADPIPTTYSRALNTKLDSSPSEKNCATPKNGMIKPVPEEAMPDLIRLVHGNLAGIKKLIKRFRTFWGQKVSGDQTPSSPAESKMEVDTPEVKVKEGETPIEKRIAMDTSEISDDVHTYCISKRQLELKISSIAVREKRATFKKVCWYVHENFQQQYNLTDLPVPNIQETDNETPKPKSEEPTTPTTSLKTPKVSITQFARHMSPSEIAAQHAAVAAKQAAEASAKLAALEAASKQAALEAVAKQQALEAAMRQAAAINAAQHGGMQVIPGASFTSPQHKAQVNFTSPSHPNFKPRAMSPQVMFPGGSPLTAKASPDNQKKRIIPTMLSPLLQKSLQSPQMGKSESQIRIVPTIISPSNPLKRMTPSVNSVNNQQKRIVTKMVSPSNPLKKMTPSVYPVDNQQKRIVPTLVSPLSSKTAVKTELPFNVVGKSPSNVRPINKLITMPQDQPKSVNNSSHSLQNPVGQMVKMSSTPQGPARPVNQMVSSVVGGHDSENAIVID